MFNPWLGKIPWRRKWQPPPVFLPGESHGQRSLVGYSPWGHKRAGYNLATKEQQQSINYSHSRRSHLSYAVGNLQRGKDPRLLGHLILETCWPTLANFTAFWPLAQAGWLIPSLIQTSPAHPNTLSGQLSLTSHWSPSTPSASVPFILCLQNATGNRYVVGVWLMFTE